MLLKATASESSSLTPPRGTRALGSPAAILWDAWIKRRTGSTTLRIVASEIHSNSASTAMLIQATRERLDASACSSACQGDVGASAAGFVSRVGGATDVATSVPSPDGAIDAAF